MRSVAFIIALSAVRLALPSWTLATLLQKTLLKQKKRY